MAPPTPVIDAAGEAAGMLLVFAVAALAVVTFDRARAWRRRRHRDRILDAAERRHLEALAALDDAGKAWPKLDRAAELLVARSTGRYTGMAIATDRDRLLELDTDREEA